MIPTNFVIFRDDLKSNMATMTAIFWNSYWKLLVRFYWCDLVETLWEWHHYIQLTKCCYFSDLFEFTERGYGRHIDRSCSNIIKMLYSVLHRLLHWNLAVMILGWWWSSGVILRVNPEVSSPPWRPVWISISTISQPIVVIGQTEIQDGYDGCHIAKTHFKRPSRVLLVWFSWRM